MNYSKKAKRYPSELRFDKPIVLIFKGEGFVAYPPSALLVFTPEMEIDEGSNVSSSEPDRWALRVGGRVLAVMRRGDGADRTVFHRTVPGNEFTLELSARHTRVRRDYRRHLTPAAANYIGHPGLAAGLRRPQFMDDLPEARPVGTTKNGAQFKV